MEGNKGTEGKGKELRSSTPEEDEPDVPLSWSASFSWAL